MLDSNVDSKPVPVFLYSSGHRHAIKARCDRVGLDLTTASTKEIGQTSQYIEHTFYYIELVCLEYFKFMYSDFPTGPDICFKQKVILAMTMELEGVL